MGGRESITPVLVGPTAIGKTAVVLEWGKRHPLVAVSADSRQVYRRLDVGTAKPTPEERKRVRHVGIDLVEPDDSYSAGRFSRDALEWLAAVDEGHLGVVVGGTGLYVRALVDGLFREPPMSTEARRRFRSWAANQTVLSGWADRLDPDWPGGGGRQRAARTVEVALLTGRPLSRWQREAKQEGGVRPWIVRLTGPRTFLHRRIEDRVVRMLNDGWIDEVDRLLESGIEPTAPGLNAVGYREIVEYLRGERTLEDLVPAITVSTRRYAKRQETWFRHQLGDRVALTIDVVEGVDGVVDRITSAWEQAGEI